MFHATLCSGAEGFDAQIAAAVQARLNIAIETWPLPGSETAPRAAIATDAEPLAPPTLRDARLWVGRDRLSLGLGVGVVEQSALTPAGRSAPFAVVGLRYRLSERSGSYLDSVPALHLRDGRPMFGRDVRVGLEFKPARSNALGISRGTLLRMQLNTDSQLSLRVRSGGLRLMLRSQF